MKDELIKYAEGFTSDESEVLRALREECYAHYEDSSMLSGFVQGRVLSMFSQMIRPKTVLEIGTYLGYSALCFAEGLQDVSHRRVVSYRWDDWKTEVVWMSLYFSAAVWISISLVQSRIPTAVLAREEARLLRSRRLGTNLLFKR